MKNSELVSITTFAEVAGVSRQTVHKWLQDGTVEPEIVAERRVLRRADAERIKLERSQ